jgi:coenzyme F420 hydrogenase subunit beta
MWLLMAEKPKLFGNLVTEVIRPNLCTFCGACMAVCPVNVLWPVGEQPTLIGACAVCGICYHQCPTVGFSKQDVEMFLFNRTRRQDEPIGISCGVFVGRATRTEIQSQAQDGGVVTALLAHALDRKLIGAAIVAGRDSKWRARPEVATHYEDLVKNAGTKYTPSPTLLGVRSAVDDYVKSNVGVVGTPCQIRALRRLQTTPLGNLRLAQAITLSVGLFCMESYAYDKLVETYVASKGINPSTTTRMGIKKGSFIVWAGANELLHVPLKEVDAFVRNSCKQCDDFTAEYADISVGGVGCPDGWSTVVARTEKGIELLRNAEKAGYLEIRELKPDAKGYLKIVKMAETKRSRKQTLT